MEQVTMLIIPGSHDAAPVRKDDFHLEHLIIKEAILVTRAFNTVSTNEPADGEVVVFRHDGHANAERQQRRRHVAHIDVRLKLCAHGHRVHADDIGELRQVDREAALPLVPRVAVRHGPERGPRRANRAIRVWVARANLALHVLDLAHVLVLGRLAAQTSLDPRADEVHARPDEGERQHDGG
eukprot:IDg20025t1